MRMEKGCIDDIPDLSLVPMHTFLLMNVQWAFSSKYKSALESREYLMSAIAVHHLKSAATKNT